MHKIPVGISSCLLGENVRFDGGHKQHSYITGTLSEYFDFKPFCPEVAIGLGIPRSTIQLVKQEKEIRCLSSKNPEMDVTESLRAQANLQAALHTELCGYILKKNSPSCGMTRVKVFHNQTAKPEGIGIFAEQMMRNTPLLPVEEEGRLGDVKLRENFIQRVYILHRWKTMLVGGLTPSSLTRFHAQHKLIIMSHADYRELGQLLSEINKNNIADIATLYIGLLMHLLKKIATRSNHVNVLQHIQGYLKKELSADDKAELVEIIAQYQRGDVPLIVPLTLLKHHFRKSPDPYYIQDSYYMSPYPQELQLLNQL